MFVSPGLEPLDPALLAFVKCHVTSPPKWEALRVLEAQPGTWLRIDQLARATHKTPAELASAMAELTSEGVVDELRSGDPADISYRLPASEPTTIVLHRLIEVATHSQELRGIIAAYLQQRSRRQTSGPAEPNGRAQAAA